MNFHSGVILLVFIINTTENGLFVPLLPYVLVTVSCILKIAPGSCQIPMNQRNFEMQIAPGSRRLISRLGQKVDPLKIFAAKSERYVFLGLCLYKAYHKFICSGVCKMVDPIFLKPQHHSRVFRQTIRESSVADSDKVSSASSHSDVWSIDFLYTIRHYVMWPTVCLVELSHSPQQKTCSIVQS